MSLSDTESAELPVLGSAPLDHTQGGQDRSLGFSQDSPSIPLSESLADSAIRSSAGGWQIECVDCPKQFSGMTDRSLRLDSDGHPHIAYGKDHLYYAWHDGTQWHHETVDESSGVGEQASLALDALDRPRISYYDRIDGDLKYVFLDATGWHIQTVDSEGDVGGHASLALDTAGNPHISYRGGDNLKYARWTGSTWDIQTVDSEGNVGRYTSLALDAADHPHISYYDDINSDLKYAHWTGSAWGIQTIDSEGTVGHWTSLALDAQDQPHVSYHDYTNSDLKYVRLLPSPLMLDKEATPKDGLRYGDLLTYTLTISGPDCIVRVWDPLPSLLRYVIGSITGTVTPAATYSPTAHAIVWQGRLPTGTTEVVRFQVTPGITGTGSLDLIQSIVNIAWLTAIESGRRVSASAIVNGWRAYLPLVLK